MATETHPRRIVVAAGFEAGSSWAHALNTVNMAQGFSQLGHDVTLVCFSPPSGRVSGEALSAQLGLTAPLRWVQLRSRFLGLDLKRWVGFGARARSTIKRLAPHLVYARDFDVPAEAVRLGITAVAETHAPVASRSPGLLRLANTSQHIKFSCLITISEVLADYYATLGVSREKVMVRPGGVDLPKFARPETLPPSPFAERGPNVVYAGHLYDYNGIPTLIDAARRLPSVRFHLIGGWPEDLARHRTGARGLTNLVFHGTRPHSEIPPFLWHADLLLLPASARMPAARWMSPVKLGEYLASGTPTLISDIPAFRAWLSEGDVAFVAPDDPHELAMAIRAVLGAPTQARERASLAIERARSWSVAERARAILERSRLV